MEQIKFFQSETVVDFKDRTHEEILQELEAAGWYGDGETVPYEQYPPTT